MAPPGFCNRGEVRYGSIGGLEYEVPQSRLYCQCINVALCSTTLQCICRVRRRSSMTMKAHTYYIIFGHPSIGRSFPLPPLPAPLCSIVSERRVAPFAYRTAVRENPPQQRRITFAFDPGGNYAAPTWFSGCCKRHDTRCCFNVCSKAD